MKYRSRPPEGSIAELVMLFRRSPRYLAWQASSRVSPDRILSDLVEFNGRAQVADLRRGDIIAMRDQMAETPSAANNWLKVVKLLIDYAADLDRVPYSVARDVKRLDVPNPDGLRAWREDEIDAFMAHHPPGRLPHRVLTLALYSAAARVDLVKLGRANIRDGRLRYRRQKTRKKTTIWVDIPILPPLAALIAATPPGWATFLQTTHGTMRSSFGITNDFKAWVVAAGLGDLDENGKGLSLHGLRKAMARRLAEAGAPPQAIMSVLGHKDIRMAMDYSESYDRSRAADSGLAMLDDMAAPNVVRLERKRSET